MAKIGFGLSVLLLLAPACLHAQSGTTPTDATDVTKSEMDQVRKSTPNPQAATIR